MNIEFHYYTVHYLARMGGFTAEEAGIIAYASQFVDSNIIGYHIDTGTEVYETQITQNYGFWNNDALKNINVPFHFIPGEGVRKEYLSRRDGRQHPLITRANSPCAKQLLIDALGSKNLYRIGIAVHSFADTWAHQHFLGIRSELNALSDTGIIPPIGHAQALTHPDFSDMVWSDPRLRQPRIVNLDRFLGAAQKIYRYFRIYHGQDFSDEQLVIDELKRKYTGARTRSLDERLLDFIIEDDMEKYSRTRWLEECLGRLEDPGDESLFKGYNKVLWLKDEVLYGNALVQRKAKKASPGFYESHLYKWMEAAKAHRERGLALFGHLL